MKNWIIFSAILGCFTLQPLTGFSESPALEKIQEDQEAIERNRAVDHELYEEETAPENMDTDPDYLLREHPLEEKPLDSTPLR